MPELLGLATEEGTWVGVPRLTGVPVAMECRLVQVVPVGSPPTSLILGEILGWHVQEPLVDSAGRLSLKGWGPLARLGVDGYGEVRVLPG